MARKLLRLKRGSFYDCDTGLRLRAGKPVPHPPEIGRITREWIAVGGIEVIDEKPSPQPESEPIIEEIPFAERVRMVKDRYSIAELRAKLRDAEVKFSWNAREQNLAEKLVEAGLE